MQHFCTFLHTWFLPKLLEWFCFCSSRSMSSRSTATHTWSSPPRIKWRSARNCYLITPTNNQLRHSSDPVLSVRRQQRQWTMDRHQPATSGRWNRTEIMRLRRRSRQESSSRRHRHRRRHTEPYENFPSRGQTMMVTTRPSSSNSRQHAPPRPQSSLHAKCLSASCRPRSQNCQY